MLNAWNNCLIRVKNLVAGGGEPKPTKPTNTPHLPQKPKTTNTKNSNHCSAASSKKVMLTVHPGFAFDLGELATFLDAPNFVSNHRFNVLVL